MFNIVYGDSSKIYLWHGVCNCVTRACSNKWILYSGSSKKSSHYRQTPGPAFIFTCTLYSDSRLFAESGGVITGNRNLFQQQRERLYYK